MDQPIKDDDLYLLSNEIPVSYSDPNSDGDSDPEEVIVGELRKRLTL